MRTLVKNRQHLHYATYVSKTAIKDEYGNETGESQITYSAPVKAAWNVSVVESEADIAMFGVQAVDTIVGVAEKDGFPLTETSVLWYGVTPNIKADGTTDTPHNYRIVGIRPSLNIVRFYAQKVDVTVAVKIEPEPPEPPDPEPPGEDDEP